MNGRLNDLTYGIVTDNTHHKTSQPVKEILDTRDYNKKIPRNITTCIA